MIWQWAGMELTLKISDEKDHFGSYLNSACSHSQRLVFRLQCSICKYKRLQFWNSRLFWKLNGENRDHKFVLAQKLVRKKGKLKSRNYFSLPFDFQVILVSHSRWHDLAFLNFRYVSLDENSNDKENCGLDCNPQHYKHNRVMILTYFSETLF